MSQRLGTCCVTWLIDCPYSDTNRLRIRTITLWANGVKVAFGDDLPCVLGDFEECRSRNVTRLGMDHSPRPTFMRHKTSVTKAVGDSEVFGDLLQRRLTLMS